ncbi:tetratricopeptide repeat protein 4 homolog isoform X1 [Amborella trichopoda]|uniref:tetratricopeptide repeat protein 4 homolog isoform X1 n=1 Tax=Amborella trichopoda TaxID=13333 RepID=UPI0005D3CAAE|nr:tetratricopeptide repeat protein 4 homolog isoform X1 [Amborella trichopoda]|eukprot:XP_011625912.1 tetratricopeptide repeat protein 4 homolog isoform X1 [Amborella trichopoda]
MALWMEEHSQPMTEAERADLDAIIALKEAAALELKEKGNEYVKMGKKHYPDAIDSYTRAINQKILGESESSILFANRAHVNLLLGNFRRALMDAEEAVKLCPANVKAYYRAAKATFSLDLLAEALLFCQRGLEQFPTNEELKKLAKQIESRQNENEKRKAQVSEALASAKDLVSAMESRHLKMGKAMYQVLTGMKKATLDKSNILHWPVLLLYAEVMSSDLIEDFCETDMLSAHLDILFSESCSRLPWDKERAYIRGAVELFYEAGNGILLSKREVLHNLLEGTPGAVADIVDDQKEDEDHHSCNTKSSGKWIKVNEKKTLHDVIQQPDYVIPGIPVFYVVSKRSAFYRDFTAGKWIPP